MKRRSEGTCVGRGAQIVETTTTREGDAGVWYVDQAQAKGRVFIVTLPGRGRYWVVNKRGWKVVRGSGRACALAKRLAAREK